MNWKSTNERPRFKGKPIRPVWFGSRPANFVERTISAWMWHSRQGAKVEPRELIERKYDNCEAASLIVEGSNFSFEGYSHWMPMQPPKPPKV